jgi:hypothetical protein
MPKLTGKPIERQEEKPKAQRIKRRQAPARTIESREHQIARLAYDLVEEKIRKKTASSQELIYFLKMGSSKDRIERLKLEHETDLLKAKTEAIESQKKIEELYADAIRSMALYQGREVDDEED